MAEHEKQDDLLKRRVIAVVVTHAVLLLMLLISLGFLVPKVTHLYECPAARVPIPAQRTIDLSEFVEGNVLLIVPAYFLLLLLDVIICTGLHRRCGGRAVRKWFWGVVVAIMLIVLYCRWSLYLPFSMIGELVM